MYGAVSSYKYYEYLVLAVSDKNGSQTVVTNITGDLSDPHTHACEWKAFDLSGGATGIARAFKVCWVFDSESDFSGFSSQIPCQISFLLHCGGSGGVWMDRYGRCDQFWF